MAIYRIDLIHERFIFVNQHMCQATGYTHQEMLNLNPAALLIPESRALFRDRMQRIAKGQPVTDSIQFQIKTKDGRTEWGDFYIRHRCDEKGRIVAADVVAHLATASKKRQEELVQYGRTLEALVEERTAQLHQQSARLGELNAAMRVLLTQREAEYLKIKETIRRDLQKLIEPYLLDMEKSDLSAHQQHLVDLIRLNLEEIADTPILEVGEAFLNLTPKEMQIANLIRKGQATKEIALSLGVSPRTVEAYRHLIRRKLGLKGRKVNLCTYLSSW